jgi:hypothetical protein
MTFCSDRRECPAPGERLQWGLRAGPGSEEKVDTF